MINNQHISVAAFVLYSLNLLGCHLFILSIRKSKYRNRQCSSAGPSGKAKLAWDWICGYFIILCTSCVKIFHFNTKESWNNLCVHVECYHLGEGIGAVKLPSVLCGELVLRIFPSLLATLILHLSCYSYIYKCTDFVLSSAMGFDRGGNVGYPSIEKSKEKLGNFSGELLIFI